MVYIKKGYNFKGINNGMYGKHHTEETKQNLRIKNKNISPELRLKLSLFKKGKKLSEETKRKIGLSHLGRKATLETKLKLRKPKSKEWKIKIGLANKGKIRNKETREKLRLVKLGTHFSNESREKMSKSRKGLLSKEKCHFWLGGISKFPYPFDFNEELKQIIRTRDNFRCQICNNPAFCIHHIDYNKDNCNNDNLITLCRRCHSKTNFNRKEWIEFFKFKNYFT